jgi:hypothetical protein
MKWIKVDSDLPDDQTLVWVKLPHEEPIVRLYQNDSFGLGERDYEVTYWSEYKSPYPPNLASQHHKPLSSGRDWDHREPHFSEYSLSLVR